MDIGGLIFQFVNLTIRHSCPLNRYFVFKDRVRGTITITERLDKFSKEHNLPNYQRLREINDLPSNKLHKLVDTGETYYVGFLF